MGVCVNASTVFVPATPGPIRCARSFGRIVPKTFRPTNAGGYGPLLSQGRRKRIQLSNRPNRHCEERSDAIHSFFVATWIASRSLSSGAHSRDPLARNDEKIQIHVLAAPCARVVARNPSAQQRAWGYPKGGAGNAGCPLHPQPRARSVVSTRVSHHGRTGITRHSRTQWF